MQVSDLPAIKRLAQLCEHGLHFRRLVSDSPWTLAPAHCLHDLGGDIVHPVSRGFT
jgi:hypothetical protein